ncbi:MAG: hypothetical protein RL330_1347 [Actinomycetota bacterium]
MNHRHRRLIVASLAGMLLGGPSFVADSVRAQTGSADLAAEVVNETLTFLDVETEPSETLEELAEAVAEAIEDGLIDEDVLEAIGNGEALGELLEGNLTEAEEGLEDSASLWAAAYERIKAEFRACREAADNASECATGLGFRLQIAQADALLADIDARIAALSGLTPEEQEAELARLQALREELVARLEKAQEKLLNGPGKGLENAAAIAEQARDKAEKLREEKQKISDRARDRRGDTTTDTDGAGDPTGSGSSGPGKDKGKDKGKP